MTNQGSLTPAFTLVGTPTSAHPGVCAGNAIGAAASSQEACRPPARKPACSFRCCRLVPASTCEARYATPPHCRSAPMRRLGHMVG